MTLPATTVTFDTHEAIRRLRAVGHSESQAEVIVETIRDASGPFVTREYLDSRLAEQTAALDAKMAALDARMADLRADLRTEMADLRAEMAQLRADLYRALWLLGLGVVAAVGTIVAVASALA